MPRPHRIQVAGLTYHVFAHATGSELLHRDNADRQRFLLLLEETVGRHQLELHFVVLLGTHHHLLLTTSRPNIAAAMQHLSGVYCRSYNRRHNRKGHLVAGRYGTTIVKSESHGVRIAAYLALNPVRAGLADRPEDWPWSSYASLVGLAPAWSLIRPGFLMTQFDADPPRARKLLREYVESVALEDDVAA